MCERSKKRIKNSAFSLLSLGTLLLIFPGSLFAQGGGGRSETTEKFSTVSKDHRRKGEKRPATKAPRKMTLAPPAVAAIEKGSLNILVNEGVSQVQISRADGLSPNDLILTSPHAPSLIVRTLPVGDYYLLIKKPGFFDETRNVTIAAGKRRTVRVSLRPKMSYLTVATNIADAQIEVDSVGKFDRPLRKYQIKPDVYRIKASRRGFIPQTVTADLKIPGSERDINIVLKPVRIDSMLAEAFREINGGDYIVAAELANDVLKLNPEHARANLLFGLARYHTGDLSAASYFFRAIKNGEMVKLPVRLLEETDGPKMINAELELDRDYLRFRTSSGPVDLNFRVTRQEISELQRLMGPAGIGYIVLQGKGDTYGKRIDQRLTFYSDLTALSTQASEPHCQAATKGRSCGTDIDIIYGLMSDWQSWHESNTASTSRPD